MAFCAKCGASLQEGTSFCGTCGTPVGATQSPTAGTSATGIESNIAGLLTYAPFVGWIIAIVFLVIEPYNKNKFVRFHAFQSLFLTLALIIVNIGWKVVEGVIATVSRISSFGLLSLLGIIGVLFGLAVFGFCLFLMYKAYNNERFMIPVIGPMAAKQAG